MSYYIKKAIPINAVQWFRLGDEPIGAEILENTSGGLLKTREGNMILIPGSWILGPGAEGEFWAVQDSIFHKTYEPYR